MTQKSKPLARRDALRITAVAGVSMAFGGGLLHALSTSTGLHRARVTRKQLGTLVTITVLHPDADAGNAMVETAFAEIERLETILSRHRPDAAVARLNREGVLRGAPDELVHVLRRALEYSSLTGGAFDVTVAPLLTLYTTTLNQTGTLPKLAEVQRAHALVDHRQVRVEGNDVSFGREGMSVTLDAIAKGFVVDRTVATLEAAGAQRVMVAASGDMATGKKDTAEPWNVAIQNPRASGSLGVVELRGQSIASSGDYQQSFTPDRSLNHIMDPRTGRSPLLTSGVTVVAPSAMEADAISTSTFVLGPVDGLAFLESLDGVEGMIVDKEEARVMTRGFRRFLD